MSATAWIAIAEGVVIIGLLLDRRYLVREVRNITDRTLRFMEDRRRP